MVVHPSDHGSISFFLITPWLFGIRSQVWSFELRVGHAIGNVQKEWLVFVFADKVQRETGEQVV